MEMKFAFDGGKKEVGKKARKQENGRERATSESRNRSNWLARVKTKLAD